MKIALFGATGFVGSYILDSLINSSSNSISKVVEIGLNNGIDYSDRIHFFKGDVRDKKLLEKIFLEASNACKAIEGVIHFAGLKSVAESVINPLLYWD